jgi:hypothetical protein
MDDNASLLSNAVFEFVNSYAVQMRRWRDETRTNASWDGFKTKVLERLKDG